jgi:hypothetical protein
MILNLFANIPNEVLIPIATVLFGFFTFILKGLYDSFKEIKEEVFQLKLYIERSIERYENQNTRLNNIETDVKELKEKFVNFQIQNNK